MASKSVALGADLAGGVSGALVGLVVAGPVGALGGAALAPVVKTALAEVAQHALDLRQRRAGSALQAAADTARLDVEDLARRVISDDHLLELTARALSAASAATWDGKIRALGRALASGLLAEDDARVDDEMLVVAALAVLDAPHVRLLALLATEPPLLDAREDGVFNLRMSWRRGQIEHVDPGLTEVVDALVATLIGAGLATDQMVGRTDYQARWGLTRFGLLCLDRLHEAGAQ